MKKLYLFVLAAILLASLSACGAKPTVADAALACGDRGVKSYNNGQFECNTVAEPAPAAQAPAAEKPATEDEVAEKPAQSEPAAQKCTSASVKATLNGKTSEQGEYLNGELGERVTFTTRKVVVPGKAWNETLTDAELTAVETTWVDVELCVPEGFFARIETGGLSQGTVRYEEGVTMTLKPGRYLFSLRNGGLVDWYPGAESFAAADLLRIIKESLNGNLDIKHSLDQHKVTADLRPVMDQYFTGLETIDPIKPE